MSKRQEIREKRRREELRNRTIIIVVVAAVALFFIAFLVWPSYKLAQADSHATQTAMYTTPTALPAVVTVTPGAYANAKVDGIHLGDPNARVKVDAFEDFRCSACLNYTETVFPQILQAYIETGKVYYTYHFYLVIDSNDGTDASYRSANAALCAGEQGHFWDFHDELYANQITESASLFSDVRLTQMAENLKLDMAAFNACYKAKQFASVIQADATKAQSLNLNSTPSILVNGKLVADFRGTNLTTAIDAALAGK